MDPSGIYQDYLTAYEPGGFLALFDALAPELHLLANPARTIPISPAPVLFDRRLEGAFTELTTALWSIVADPAYRDLCSRNIPRFLLDPAPAAPPPIPFDADAGIGCLDVHLENGAPRLIEFMVLPPGMSGIYPGLLDLYRRHLERLLPGRRFDCFAGGWDRDRCEEAIVQGMLGPREVERVAIVDWQPESQITYGEFRCLLGMIRRNRGVDGLIADPRQVVRQGPRVLVRGLPVDRIVNRMTLPDWQSHQGELAAYTRLVWEAPEVFSHHPYQWFLGDKNSLALLSDPGVMERLIADAALRNRLRAFIPATFPLSTFCFERGGEPRRGQVDVSRLLARFPDPSRLVLKPVSSHASKGVFYGPVDTPDRARLEEALLRIDPGEYVAMELVPPPEILVPRGAGLLERWKYDIRLFVLNGRYAFPGGRIYLGEYTNQLPCRAFAPLYFV